MAALRVSTALLLLALPVSARTLSRYALILQDAPAAAWRSVVRVRGYAPEVDFAAAVLRDRQATLRSELARRGIRVAGATQTLVNAVYVAAEPSRLAELRALPGVQRVVFLPAIRPALDHAEQLVNLPGAWTLLGGVSQAGSGIKIAVIDSGIDQTHPAFQDPTLTAPLGYPVCAPEDCAFTNSKVIVARSYLRQQGAGSSNDPAKESRPDDFSPRDHQGHGTAVAMIIGGRTNAGPGDTITGFAPRAYLGNYKVFGTTGVNDQVSEDVVILALEDAVKDGMDIANLSLGGPALTGPLDSGTACGETAGTPCDTLSQAVENAAAMGMLVVTAAGNEGASGSTFPTLGTASTPGIAPSAIAVAATTNSHVWQFGSTGWIGIEIGNYNNVANFSSRGPALGTAAIKPDIAAVGTSLFLTAEDYDSTGDLYSSTRYTVSQGTSFSSPMVAGAAALVKQRNPGWQPWQLKSALMNTATQDVTYNGQPAGVTAVGAGKLDSGAAVASSLTINPQSVSFGAPAVLPVTQTFQVQNNGGAAVNAQLSVNNPSITLAPASFSIGAGQSATFTAMLGGSLPAPGSYEGYITVQTESSTLHIPYLYLVSDGVPNGLIPLLGDGGIGLVSSDVPDGMLAFEVIDQYGLPVPNVPVTFSALIGGGHILNPSATTNVYGIATAEAITGPNPSTNVFSGAAGGVTLRFTDAGVAQPLISAGGVVNSASFMAGPGIAPGSYISIFGSNLSLTNASTGTSRLPLAIRNVSVSFDVPEAGISVPGHVIFVSPQQVNVQVPWELQGQKTVQMKVSISTASGAVLSVPVADYSPGLFAAPTDPVAAGDTVSLYGTGFGPVNNAPASGDPAADATSTTLLTPAVTIGGLPARVQFSGLAPGYAGLYQINVTIPNGVVSGMQPVSVSMNGVAANAVQLPIQ